MIFLLFNFADIKIGSFPKPNEVFHIHPFERMNVLQFEISIGHNFFDNKFKLIPEINEPILLTNP